VGATGKRGKGAKGKNTFMHKSKQTNEEEER
jgi:hypothetical protein